MNEIIRIRAPWKTIDGSVSLPISKSMANRIIMLKAYSGELNHPPDDRDSGDTTLLKRNLQKIAQQNDEGEPVRVDCGNAGTVFRFLLPFLAKRKGTWILTGEQRMLERPVGPLVSALNSLGADIEYLEENGYPPLRVNGKTLSSGEVKVDTSISSQFVSALLLLAPFLESGLSIKKTGENVSGSYTSMTTSLLRSAGISVSVDGDITRVFPGIINTTMLKPEYDWSSASFWYTVVALSHHGTITLRGLTPPESSIQGDSSVAGIFRSLGVFTNNTDDGLVIRKSFSVPTITRIRLNMRSTPDLVLPVVTAIAGLGYGALISGIDHLRYKESDRIRALITELRALNAYIDYAEKMLVVHPSDIRYLRPVNTYNDHRMAMAFAPLALISRTLEVRDPGVVMKSYPEFWSMMEELGFEMIRI